MRKIIFVSLIFASINMLSSSNVNAASQSRPILLSSPSGMPTPSSTATEQPQGYAAHMYSSLASGVRSIGSRVYTGTYNMYSRTEENKTMADDMRQAQAGIPITHSTTGIKLDPMSYHVIRTTLAHKAKSFVDFLSPITKSSVNSILVGTLFMLPHVSAETSELSGKSDQTGSEVIGMGVLITAGVIWLACGGNDEKSKKKRGDFHKIVSDTRNAVDGNYKQQ